MTDGGLGVAFFAPFNNHRYFLPWRPIHVSPIGAGRFFTHRGVEVLQSELLWIWLPAALLALSGWLMRQRGAPST
jgi:inner membrane protein